MLIRCCEENVFGNDEVEPINLKDDKLSIGLFSGSVSSFIVVDVSMFVVNNNSASVIQLFSRFRSKMYTVITYICADTWSVFNLSFILVFIPYQLHDILNDMSLNEF